MTYTDLISKIPASQRHLIPTLPVFKITDADGTALTVLTRNELALILKQNDVEEAWIFPIRESESSSADFVKMLDLLEAHPFGSDSSFHVPDIEHPEKLLPSVMMFGDCEEVIAPLISLSKTEFVIRVKLDGGDVDTEVHPLKWV